MSSKVAQAKEIRAQRARQGTAGTHINVTVNAYKVAIKSRIVYHYDVAVEGSIGKGGTVGDVPPSLGREIFQCLKAQTTAFDNVPFIYDGRKNVFSPTSFKWPDNRQTFDIDLAHDEPEGGKRARKFRVTLTKVADVNLDSLMNYVKKQAGAVPDDQVQTAITALNVLCNHDLMMAHPNSKNKFFPEPPPLGQDQYQSASILQIRGGIDIWRGYFSSIRMAPQGIILNFDLTSQPMIRSGNLAFVAADILGSPGSPSVLRQLNGFQTTQLSRMLKLIKVTVRRQDGSKLRTKIKEMGSSAKLKTFEGPVSPGSEQMRTWTVEEFFRAHYNKVLRGPDYPLVRLTAKGWYPMEVCDVEPGQKYTKKLTPDQLAEAIRWLTVKPQERTQMLTQGVSEHLARSSTLAQWGLRLDPKPLVVPARRLPPPVMNYNIAKGPARVLATVKVENGSWNMVSKQLLKPMQITCWMAVAFGVKGNFGNLRPDSAARALDGLQKAMQAVGIQVSGLIAPTIFARGAGAPNENIEGSVGKWVMAQAKQHSSTKPQLVVCFLKDKNAWQYRQLKLFGDSEQGLASQCLSIDKVITKGNPQYYANVTLKINAKLGGTNHGVGQAGKFFRNRIMVMGADVTHPSGDSLEPSIAAVVGSTNEYAGGYGAEFGVQLGKQEMIEDLTPMAKSLLLKFAQRNGNKLPERLLFYRDGVSEGQFSEVMVREIPRIRAAIAEIGHENPNLREAATALKLTFIVCGKRHHFRFGPTREGQRQDGDRNGNLLPGVVVDSGIVHPFDFDWYGLSHGGLLGTSRASHYTVLVDDHSTNVDELQTITYHLCYTYARATRSVSIATPAYYAHHVCTRIKQLLAGVEHKTSSSTPTQIDITQALASYQHKAREIRNCFRNSSRGPAQPMMEYWQ